jgi:hypothetical protein
MHQASRRVGWAAVKALVRAAVVGGAAAFALAAMLLLAGPAVAQPEQATPPALVGQLASTDGQVWLFDREQDEWRSSRHEALRNWPLTSGDRLRTDTGARSTLRVASVTVRLDGDSELELARIEPGQLVFRLWRGSAAWNVMDDQQARWLTLLADPARVQPQRAGHYRIDQHADDWRVTTWRGEAVVQADGQEIVVKAGRQATLRSDGPGWPLQVRLRASERDPFADWVLREARDDVAPRSARQLGDQLSGWQALDRHGRWRDDPEWGAIWLPVDVPPGWTPYRDGRWVWVNAWGWTWVDAAPWGFVTVHYGRWIPWRGRWAWQPTPRHQPPVYRPVPPGLVPPPPRPRREWPAPRPGDHRPGDHRPADPPPGVHRAPGDPASRWPVPGRDRPWPPEVPGASTPRPPRLSDAPAAAPPAPPRVVAPVLPATPPPPVSTPPGPVVQPARPPVVEAPDRPTPRVPGFRRPQPEPVPPVPATPPALAAPTAVETAPAVGAPATPAVRPDRPRPDQLRPDPARPDNPRPDTPRPDNPRGVPPRPEPPPPSAAAAPPDRPRPAVQRAPEAARPDAPQAEAPRTEQQRPVAPRTGPAAPSPAPAAAPPRPEPPKPAAEKPEAPKADPARGVQRPANDPANPSWR